MPLTDFLKNFLQKLPENIQYLGTDVAPLMGPNWQQAIELEKRRNQQMAEAQQTQANWEKQFGAQQTQQNRQYEVEQGRLQLEALKNFQQVPQGAQPQQSPGGPSLTGGGAGIGAGGGAMQAPSPQGPAPQQSTDDIMEMLQPGWRAFTGQQQSGGQAINAAGQPAPGGAPAQRMPGMTGDSGGGGGAMVPSAAGSAPMRPIMPTAFNISGLPDQQWQQRPEPMIPLPPGMAENWPQMAKAYPNGIPESHLPHLQTYLDANERLQAAKNKPPGDKESLDETTLKSIIKRNDPTFDGDYKKYATASPELFAQARGKLEEINHPGTTEARQAAIAQRQAAEQDLADKLKLSKIKQTNAEDLVRRIQQDPKAAFDKKENPTTRSYAQALASIRGIDWPTRDLEGQRARTDAYSLDMLAANSKLKDLANQIIQRDPNQFNALMGLWDSQNMKWGARPSSSDPTLNRMLGSFYDISNGLAIAETQQAVGGRPAIGMFNTIKEIIPNLAQHPDLLKGAFDAVDFWAHARIKDNRDYMMGRLPSGGHQNGDIVFDKQGKKTRVSNLKPNGEFDPIEVK